MECWSFSISFITQKHSSFHGLSEATSHCTLFSWRLEPHGLASISYAVFNFHKIQANKIIREKLKVRMSLHIHTLMCSL